MDGPEAERLYYRLAPGTDVVRVGDGDVSFRSHAVALRLDGPAAVFFAEQVVPLLDGRRSVAEIAAMLPGVAAADLREHLERLAAARVLLRAAEPRTAGGDGLLEPFAAMLASLGLPQEEAAARLARMRVGVLGLQGHGAQTADLLARLGIGELILVDPHACRPGDLALMPLAAADAVGRPRQEAMRDLLAARGGPTRLRAFPAAAIDRESVSRLAGEADFLVSCFDRDLIAANHWVNRAALAAGVPALFARMEGHRIFAGPLLLPGETACYMCWRMRHLACADDFAEAMAQEEAADARRSVGETPPALPPLAAQLAGLVATEFVKTTLALGRPALAGAVFEHDALELRSATHPVLRRPDCPACRKKKPPIPPQPALDGLAAAASPPGDVLAAAAKLVSPRCGLIRRFQPVHKDVSEPERPYIFRAELANARFLDSHEDAFLVASGKGMTEAAARASALGEAVERYAASLWGDDRVVRAARADLPGPALDPRRLVLYRPEQYAALRYRPYDDTTVLGWVRARSLASGEELFVPALAVLLAYDVHPDEGFIFPITSNGLAAGPTLADAVLSGAYEAFERDAFLALWLHRLPAGRIDPASHPDPAVPALCRAYARRGVAMELYRVPTDHPVHVFVGLGVETEASGGPACVVGLGADLDPAAAARGALLEVAQVRPALRMRMRQPDARARLAELLDDPHRVAELTDHDLLYASPAMLGRFDFLRTRPFASLDWSDTAPRGAAARLRLLAEHLAAQGSDLVYADLTTADLADLGLHVARAILPDYQPIHFGRAERRLGGRRLYELPRRLGLRPDDAAPGDLNDDPHPLA